VKVVPRDVEWIFEHLLCEGDPQRVLSIVHA
jgi:hypothetical protein